MSITGTEISVWITKGIRKLVLTVVDDTLFDGKSFASSDALAQFVRQNLSGARLDAADGETRQDMVWEPAGVTP